MTEYLAPRSLKPYTREWCAWVVANHPWSKFTSRRLRYILLTKTVVKPDSCICGSPTVNMYSVSGEWDSPTDYIFLCQICNHARLHPPRPPGRPKGSKNKKTLKAGKKLTQWEQMCKDAWDTYEDWRIR